MDVNQQISIYSMGFNISLAIMIVSFALAVFLFFRFRIPSVFALMTGRARRREVERMRESGVLRDPEVVAKEREEYVKARGSGHTEDYVTEQVDVSIQGPGAAGDPDNPLTTVFGKAPAPGAFESVYGSAAQPDQQMQEQESLTIELDRLKDYGFLFETVEHLAVVHTNEFI